MINFEAFHDTSAAAIVDLRFSVTALAAETTRFVFLNLSKLLKFFDRLLAGLLLGMDLVLMDAVFTRFRKLSELSRSVAL